MRKKTKKHVSKPATASGKPLRAFDFTLWHESRCDGNCAHHGVEEILRIYPSCGVYVRTHKGGEGRGRTPHRPLTRSFVGMLIGLRTERPWIATLQTFHAQRMSRVRSKTSATRRTSYTAQDNLGRGVVASCARQGIWTSGSAGPGPGLGPGPGPGSGPGPGLGSGSGSGSGSG